MTSVLNTAREKKNIVELTRWSIEEYAGVEKLPVKVVLDNVRSLHNIGSLFRTSDAFGVEEMVLCGITGCPPHPELSKTALGAEKSVSWRYAVNAVTECFRLREEGWLIAVLEQAHGSVPLDAYRRAPGQRVALVVGNEVEGVAQEIVSMADVVLEIPQRGVKHSLNVSVSGGLAIWQLTR